VIIAGSIYSEVSEVSRSDKQTSFCDIWPWYSNEVNPLKITTVSTVNQPLSSHHRAKGLYINHNHLLCYANAWTASLWRNDGYVAV